MLRYRVQKWWWVFQRLPPLILIARLQIWMLQKICPKIHKKLLIRYLEKDQKWLYWYSSRQAKKVSYMRNLMYWFLVFFCLHLKKKNIYGNLTKTDGLDSSTSWIVDSTTLALPDEKSRTVSSFSLSMISISWTGSAIGSWSLGCFVKGEYLGMASCGFTNGFTFLYEITLGGKYNFLEFR